MRTASLLCLASLSALSSLGQCAKSTDPCATKVQLTPSGTTTSTSYDNSARKAANAEAASNMALTSMKFFMLDLPEIQTMRHNAVNRREAHFTPTYELLDSLTAVDTPASAQTAPPGPTIKKFYLGESWSDFLKDAPTLSAWSAKCATEPRPDPNKKRKRIDFNPCANIWAFNDKLPVNLTLDCLREDMRPGKDTACRDFNGEVIFNAGKLVGLKVVIDNEWKDVQPDIIAKFGEPTGGDPGGTFNIWTLPDSHVVAVSVDDGTAIEWVTPTLYAAAVKQQQQAAEPQKQGRGSTLD